MVSGVGSQPSETPEALAPRHDLGHAMEFFRQERFSDAMDLLHALPAEAESDPDVQLLLAALLTNRGQLSQAETLCERLLAHDELNAAAHYLRALCREHEGDHASAVDHDRVAVYLDPNFAMPHLHLGLLAKRKRHYTTARQELALAAALLPQEDPGRILLFGGGFSRDALTQFCQAQLRLCEEMS